MFHCNLFSADNLSWMDDSFLAFENITLLQNCGTLKTGEKFVFGCLNFSTMLLELYRDDMDENDHGDMTKNAIVFPLMLVPKTN